MKKEEAIVLGKYLDEMLEGVKDLEFAEKNKNAEELNQAKMRIMSLKSKIDGLI